MHQEGAPVLPCPPLTCCFGSAGGEGHRMRWNAVFKWSTPDSRALSRGPYAGIPRRPWRQPLPSARWGPAGTALLGAICGPPPTAPRDRAGRHRSRIRAWGGAVAGWGERPSGPPGGRPSPACAAARGQHSPADGLPARQAGAGRGAERLGPGEAGPGFLAVTTPHALWVYGEAYF